MLSWKAKKIRSLGGGGRIIAAGNPSRHVGETQRKMNMKNNRKNLAASALSASLLLATGFAPAATAAGIIDLGLYAVGEGVNNSGQAVGRIGVGLSTAFLYSNGTSTSLGALGSLGSDARAINNAGTIVGGSPANDGKSKAFVYQNGTMTNLGTLGGNYSEAWAISPNGMIVGDSTLAGDSTRNAFLYSGSMSNLGNRGGLYASAAGINDSGSIVMTDRTGAGNTFEGYLYSGGSATKLGTLGGLFNVPSGINASGQIVGTSETAGGILHAYLDTNGTLTDIGSSLGGHISFGNAIDDNGDIVGAAERGNGNVGAFLYANGAMIDLNSLLPAGSGWTDLDTAYGISNDGTKIVGTGTFNGNAHGFELDLSVTATPEPGSMGLLAAGAAMLAYRLRRRK